MNLALSLLYLCANILALPVETEANGGTCGVQYEPNNVVTDIMNDVNFDTNPFLYSILGGTSGGPGFSAYLPYIFAQVNGSVISARTDRPGIIISQQGYNLTEGGAIQVKATFSYRSDLVSGVVTSPLGYDEDPFYSAGFFGLLHLSPEYREMFFTITNNKVYATLAYSTEANPGSFTRYMIPVADKTVDTVYTYSVTLSSDYSLSFRIDDKEVLRIFPLGRPIDPRFDVGLNSGGNIALDVPNPVYMIIGLTNFELSTVEDPNQPPRTVCQRTLFRQCRQNLRNAVGSNCQYSSPLDYNGNTVFEMQMDFEDISAVTYRIDEGCPTAPGCSPAPVTCPRVKPEHRRKPRNPMPINAPTGPALVQQKPAQSPAPPATPNTCGCRGF